MEIIAKQDEVRKMNYCGEGKDVKQLCRKDKREYVKR